VDSIVLNLGWGGVHIPKWPVAVREVTVDVTPPADIVCDVRHLKVEDEYADYAYASHIIEHIDDHETVAMLREWLRVLKPGGHLNVKCPDIGAVMKAIPSVGLDGTLYQSPAGPITPLDTIYGLRSAIAAGGDWMRHKTAFDAGRLHKALTSAGFSPVVVSQVSLELNAWGMRPK